MLEAAAVRACHPPSPPPCSGAFFPSPYLPLSHRPLKRCCPPLPCPPCSGGIQLAWPQYGVGPLPTNGFLQHLHWSVIDTAWRQPDMEAAAQQAAEGPEGSSSVGLASMQDWRPTISLYADTGEQAAGGQHRSTHARTAQLSSGTFALHASLPQQPVAVCLLVTEHTPARRQPALRPPACPIACPADEEWAKEWPHKFEALYSVTLMQPDPEQPSDLEVMRQAAERYQPWVQRQQQEQQLLDSQPAAAPQGRPGWGGGVTQAQQQQRQRDQRLEEMAHEQQAQHAAVPSVLRCLLQVHNSDDKPLTFTTGLRTHFATQDIPSHPKFVKTLGLKGELVGANSLQWWAGAGASAVLGVQRGAGAVETRRPRPDRLALTLPCLPLSSFPSSSLSSPCRQVHSGLLCQPSQAAAGRGGRAQRAFRGHGAAGQALCGLRRPRGRLLLPRQPGERGAPGLEPPAACLSGSHSQQGYGSGQRRL